MFKKSFLPVAKKTKSPSAVEQINGMIRTIRRVRVMLDRDLAKIYWIPHIPLQSSQIVMSSLTNLELT